MKTAFLTLLLLTLPTVAAAQSDPFELPHPTTGELGVWIPVWAQKLHLDTDLALRVCSTEREVLLSKLSVQDAELTERRAAIVDLNESITALNTQLVAESQTAQLAEEASHNRLIWALLATGGVVVTGTILAVVAL